MIDKLNEILQRIVKTDGQKPIDENTVILRDLDINSMEFMALICVVEDEFDIEVSNKDLKRIITIGDLIAYIESQQ